MEQLEVLKQISNNLKAQAIHISITGIISTEFQMQNVSSRFNKRSGILYLYDKETSNKLVVETNMAYRVITSEDTELKAILNDILSIVKDTNKKVEACYIKIYQLMQEVEQTRVENWYRDSFRKKDI